jgi:hypothetical protein
MAPGRPIRILAVGSLLAIVGAIAVAVMAVTVVAPTGCAGNCASNCPNATVYIGNLDNQQLAIDNILVNGPACPPLEGVYCIGDGFTTSCTHLTITGVTQGACDVLVIFPDRPAQIVHTEFGPPIKQGCCKGYSIIGDEVFVIPANPDAGIVGLDGGMDQVTTVVDGGADAAGDGGVD